MSFLSGIKGFDKGGLKKTDTMVTTRRGEQYREERDDDGTVKRTLVGTVDFTDREMAEILPGLYLSSQHVACDLDLLNENKVTHIVNVTTDVKNSFPDKITYLNIEVPDLPDTKITKTFPEVFAFIDAAIQDGGRVLVHCNMGVSRSASIVIGYVMARRQMPFRKAHDHVKSKRSAIYPNYGFRKQLEAYKWS